MAVVRVPHLRTAARVAVSAGIGLFVAVASAAPASAATYSKFVGSYSELQYCNAAVDYAQRTQHADSKGCYRVNANRWDGYIYFRT